MHNSAALETVEHGSEPLTEVVADPPLWYTVPEVARQLRLSDRKTWTLIKNGTIPSFKVDASRRVHRDVLEEYAAAAAGRTPAEHAAIAA